MLDDTADPAINLAQRQVLITALPCFSMLNPTESAELAALMVEHHYPPATLIVTEEDLVDSVYIIASGQAEVTHQVTKKNILKKVIKTSVPIAVINPGDAIGLNDTGFFSKTGKRTASVSTLNQVIALKLDLKNLHQFLQKHPHLQAALYAATGQILRMRLIKQSLPFVKLSHERTQWLASQVEEMSVAKGTFIFKQGEVGDRCYLICSGQVEIIVKDEDGAERQLDILKTPTLFGEATLITHSVRNASAYAIDDVELLVLQHKHLSELLETESNVANMFMTLMVDRSRPLQNPNISVHPRTTSDGQSIYILKNSSNRSYFKLSKEGLFIWQQLNGKQTMQAITMALANECDLFAPDVVAGLISKLAKAGFISHVEVNDETAIVRQSKLKRAFHKLRNILEFRYAFGDADKWLSKTYNKVIYLIFTHLGKIGLALLAISGFIVFAASTSSTIDTFKIMPNVWMIIALLVPCTIISVALHELGHAFTTKHFGYEVHYMGVGWFWFGPVAFTDTSDMWLSSKIPRTIVNMAGVYTDVLVAGFCSLLILLIANPYIQAFLWLFALFTYINAFRMMSPLQELDGYYVLMDLVEKPHLRQAAVYWLVKKFPKCLRHPSLFKKNKPEVYYWLACLGFLFLISCITLFVQTFVLKILGFHPSLYISLSIPILAAIFSSLGVIGDIRNQSD